jgi:hypothetical protein
VLRAGQAEVPSSPPTACQIVLQQFQHYLRQERGLSEATIMRQTPVVSALLAECLPAGIPDFHQISAKPVSNFELLKDVGPPRIGEERLSLNDHF